MTQGIFAGIITAWWAIGATVMAVLKWREASRLDEELNEEIQRGDKLADDLRQRTKEYCDCRDRLDDKTQELANFHRTSFCQTVNPTSVLKK